MDNVNGFDLTAYRAANAEASQKPFLVTLGIEKDDEGNERLETLEIPPIRQWPIVAQSKMAEGDIVGGIEELTGPEGAELFAKYRWTFGEFEALFNELGKWSGFQTGQTSPAPPRLGLTRPSN